MSDIADIMNPLESCLKRIREIIGYAVNEMTAVQHLRIKKMNEIFTDEISKQYAVIWRATEHMLTAHLRLEEVKNAITAFCSFSNQNCAYLAEGNTNAKVNERIAAVMEQLKELANQTVILSELPKAEEKYLITMESFGICRCGGILRFETSGQ